MMQPLLTIPEFPRYCSIATCREQVPGPETKCDRHAALHKIGELGQCLSCRKLMENPAIYGNNCTGCAYKQNSTVNRHLKIKHGGTLYARRQGKCPYCNRQLTIGEAPHHNSLKAHLDHMQPRSKGGRDNLDNLQLTCESCNKDKGNMSDQEYRNYLTARKRLF